MSESAGQCYHLRREPYTGDPYHPLAEKDRGEWYRCRDCGTIYQDPVPTTAGEPPATETN